MANDPNRDLLPVKEENGSRGTQGYSERFDYQTVVKLSKPELEDRVLSLLDEKTQLRKLLNTHEDTSKRLRTKLQRLTRDKKSKRNSSEQCAVNEDLNLRIIELEHENYMLKDKNTVLKQQLASHSRHLGFHRSPMRSTHASPLMSVRQSALPNNEMPYNSSDTNPMPESQMRDPQLHMKQLNEEIKLLHCKIDYLQEDVERNSVDTRKTKVTENIELIRLQRSLKQQAIQIGALQAQVRTSENNQKLLKEELIRAHNENDEAMNLIALKQNEILSLCAKLEKKNLNRFEEEELLERINDLTKERDALKERSDFLINTIGVKAEEVRRTESYQKLLAEEKLKKEKLEESLKKTQLLVKSLQESNKNCGEGNSCNCRNANEWSKKSPEVLEAEKKVFEPHQSEGARSLQNRMFDATEEDTPDEESEDLEENKRRTVQAAADHEETTESDELRRELLEPQANAEKVKMERELQYLREMLRNQTALCSAQQTEISRLTQELKANEDKYKSTLQRLEPFLKKLEQSHVREDKKSSDVSSPATISNEEKQEKQGKQGKQGKQERQERQEKQERQERQEKQEKSHSTLAKSSGPEKSTKESKYEGSKPTEKRNDNASDSDSVISGLFNSETFAINPLGNDEMGASKKRASEFDSRKKFVDQVFLESSDDEEANEEKFEKITLMKKLEILENDFADSDAKRKLGEIVGSGSLPARSKSCSNSLEKISSEAPRKSSPGSVSLTSPMDYEYKGKEKKNANVKNENGQQRRVKAAREKEEIIQIGILWLQLDMKCHVWKNEDIQLLFVDFSFLEIKGEETETPNSLRKPKTSDEKCEFNFYKNIVMTESKKKKLESSLGRPDLDLIVFKVVSDPEKSYDDFECEDIGVAVVTVKQFLYSINNGAFVIPVQNVKNCKEVIGKLAVNIGATPGIDNFKY